jgi:hypothetical protein
MKKLSALLLCGLLLATASPALHAQQQGQYKIDKITPSFIATPQYQFQGEQRTAPNQEGKWLEVEVQFESAVETTDEMTVKYYILVNGTLLAGEVTHVNIPKSRELYSVMYVSPRTLARLLGANKPATANAIGDVGVQLLIKGQVVAEMSTKSGYAAEWWQQMQQTTGLLLNKNETPFAPLYWDRYEAIKAEGH